MTLKPPKLKNKDVVALVAPSGIVSKTKFNIAFKNIRKLGLIPVYKNSFCKNFGYLADTDFNRSNDLNVFFEDKILSDAIFCIRGGYGATRILNQIKYDKILLNPKIFVGFSDITAFQSAIYIKTGLVSFHGIVAASEFSDYTVTQIQNLLFNPTDNYKLPLKSIKVLNNGTTQGKIVGGNLSLLTSLIGTEYLYKFENNIVFIEEIAEPPYKIDRMINHLLMATDLKKAAAIVFGKFNKCTPKDYNMTGKNSFTVEQIFKQYFSDFNFPVVFDVNFGHINDGLIFPIGVKAELNTKHKEIILLEKAVI